MRMLLHVALVVGCCVALSSQTSPMVFQTIQPLFETIPPLEAKDPKCLERPETGVCRAAIPMYYYDPSSDSCESFIWGGCPGSNNKFTNKESCIRTCQPEICQEPPVTGPCRADVRMWYYDSEHLMCKEFSYGGCEGNDNRFPSEQHCRSACGGTNVPCEMGTRFETVGWNAVNANYRDNHWFTYRCEGRCREQCSEDHSWGTCLAFSVERKWYKCSCYLYDRFLSKADFDSGSKGITRNRQCAFDETSMDKKAQAKKAKKAKKSSKKNKGM